MAVDLESYASPQIDLFKELDRAALAKDLSLLAKPLHKDYHHVIHPPSLGKLPVNRDDWLASMAEAFNTPMQFERASYTGATQSSPRLNSLTDLPFRRGSSREGCSSCPFKGLFEDRTDESIWIVGFASGEDGSLKIKEIEQFADTSNYLDVIQAGKASK
ncbi:hypothetical protein EV363DRAFT_1224489, partial [Boletus edulis]|uniref:Uncharacterized protein n=1 Tax=Boletus edulis BED1 TaxID=1328754 RepID=A0AAD4BRD8_BOLED